MWQQYKKTFGPMQTFIVLVTVAVLVVSRGLTQTAACFVVMQIAAVFGARWAVRLRTKMDRATEMPRAFRG